MLAEQQQQQQQQQQDAKFQRGPLIIQLKEHTALTSPKLGLIIKFVDE
jgi:hypothetical protein